MTKAILTWRPARPYAVRPTKERAHYRMAAWGDQRLRVLIGDAYTCRSCETSTAVQTTHAAHIIPLADGGTDDDANLQTFCPPIRTKSVSS